MSEDWKNDRAEAAMREFDKQNMVKALKLKKETDPREIEYYQKAFPDLTSEEQEQLRVNWIKNNIK